MIKHLMSMFGSTARETPARASGVRKTTLAKPASPLADFRAVAVQSSGICCAAARNAAGTRVLMRSMPRLPLPECSMPESCQCKFRKMPDRRGSDRRLGGITTHRWYSGTENRQLRGRRNGDVLASA